MKHYSNSGSDSSSSSSNRPSGGVSSGLNSEFSSSSMTSPSEDIDRIGSSSMYTGDNETNTTAATSPMSSAAGPSFDSPTHKHARRQTQMYGGLPVTPSTMISPNYISNPYLSYSNTSLPHPLTTNAPSIDTDNNDDDQDTNNHASSGVNNLPLPTHTTATMSPSSSINGNEFNNSKYQTLTVKGRRGFGANTSIL